MDNRNNAIPYDKITARDISDTQRRGMCMAAAMTFGLAYELWAKMPLENPYRISSDVEVEGGPVAAPKAGVPPKTPAAQAAPKAAPAADTGGTSEVTEADFRECCLGTGLSTHACDGVLSLIKGDYQKGIETLRSKSSAEIEGLNSKFAPAEGGDEQW